MSCTRSKYWLWLIKFYTFQIRFKMYVLHIMVLEYFLSYSFIKIKMRKWGHISFLSFWICKRLLRKIEHKHITKYLNLSKLSISWQSFFLCIALFHVMYCRLICKSSQKYAFEVWKSYIHICIWMNAYIYTCQPYNSVHVLISCFSRMSNKKGIEYTMWSKWMFVWDSLIIIGGTFIKLHVFSARMIWAGQHLKTS